MSTEYYEALGIEKNASEAEIKSAYKKCAMKCHPDRNHGNEAKAEEEFKKVTEAYTVLSDPEKRTHYDRFGNTEGGGHDMPQHDINEIFRNMFGGGGVEVDLGGMFGSMFGNRQQKQANVIHCEVSLEEVYNGTTKHIEYELSNSCHACN